MSLNVPIGTQIVMRIVTRSVDGTATFPSGAVGTVIDVPTTDRQTYRARFPGGAEVLLRRHEFAVRKHDQREGFRRASEPSGGARLDDYVIYRCIVGSRAYGLDEPGSDVDRRGIYLPPAELQWSLFGVPEQLENPATEECYWELQRFLTLALKANPNVLECLYSPLVETATPLAQELLNTRSIFLSRMIYQTYNGYVMSQFRKLEQDLRVKGAVKWKHAMHLIRLLLSGIVALKEGFVPLRIEEHRDPLLAIRRGELSWEDVNAWRLALHQEFDTAFAATALPERPDYEHANDFLIKARRSMVSNVGH